MCFQLVEAMVMGDLKRLLVFNVEKAVDLSEVELIVGNDPAIILRNGFGSSSYSRPTSGRQS
jgi:hypothetical protein